jgi:putative ABC transport system substrate-binding protein
VRRVALAFALWLCAAMAAFAQNPGNLPIVGVLRVNTADTVEPTATGFKEALAALGLVDGRNIRLEVRLAEGHVERLPELAQSLVQAKARVIVAYGAPAIRAVQRATSTIPIVANGDLLSEGLIGSLARPGGNTSGVSILNTELDAKRLEVLKQIVPLGRRFALLRDPAFSFPAQIQAITDAGHALGVELQIIDVRGPADLAPAFAACRASGVEAINVLTSPMLFSSRSELGSGSPRPRR